MKGLPRFGDSKPIDGINAAARQSVIGRGHLVDSVSASGRLPRMKVQARRIGGCASRPREGTMNSLRRILVCTIWAALGGLAAGATPQSDGGPYRLEPATIASGGGSASGGGYRLDGTLGQPAAATLTGASYVLHDGFWGPASNVAGDTIFANGFDL
jgi:hypothetical protein